MVALARHIDAELGLPAEIRRIADATSGAEQVEAMVSLQARTDPSLWAVARAVEVVSRNAELMKAGLVVMESLKLTPDVLVAFEKTD
jgi:hypothetical protein